MNLAALTGPDAPATITVEQAAEVLGVSRGVAYEAVRTGELPALRLGRRRLIAVPRLLDLLGAAPPAEVLECAEAAAYHEGTTA